MNSGPTLSGATAILTTTAGVHATDTTVSIQLSGRIFQSLDVVLANRQGICRTDIGTGSARTERYALDVTSIPLTSLGADLTLRIDWTAGTEAASVELDLELELAGDAPTGQSTATHHVGTLRFDDVRHSLTATLPRSELIPR